MKLTKQQLNQLIREEISRVNEEPHTRWNHEFQPVILGAMQELGIPSDVIRPSEILKLAIELIDGVFAGDVELAKAVAEAGGQQQSAHSYEDERKWK